MHHFDPSVVGKMPAIYRLMFFANLQDHGCFEVCTPRWSFLQLIPTKRYNYIVHLSATWYCTSSFEVLKSDLFTEPHSVPSDRRVYLWRNVLRGTRFHNTVRISKWRWLWMVYSTFLYGIALTMCCCGNFSPTLVLVMTFKSGYSCRLVRTLDCACPTTLITKHTLS